MGGATGSAYTNPLLGSGMPPEAILAREAIQNSCDAELKNTNQKVKIQFRRVLLSGQRKAKFIEQAGLKEILKREKSLALPSGNCLSHLDDADQPLHLLYIEDYGTHGLWGKPHDDGSHFFRLLLSLGDPSKIDGESSGGSYGFGKSVYSANSRINALFAYSTYDPALSGDDSNTRLMGCAYLPKHKFENQSFSGRAWLGKPEGADLVHPLSDLKAQEAASNLGFTIRSAEETGTSILIVDCGIDTEKLRESIEEWWWPRLIENNLDVVIYENQTRIDPPRPKIRNDLKPFIECFELATNRADATPPSQKKGDLNKMHQRQLGSFGYTLIQADKAEGDELKDKLGCVALIRNPRMVVSYYQTTSLSSINVVGAFVADPGIDNILRMSEPANHDKWDPKSSRLDALPTQDRDFVEAVCKRLKQGLRNFANAAMPATPPSEIRPRFLEKLLGNLFKPTTSDRPGPGTQQVDPVSIRFTVQPHTKVSGDNLKIAATMKIALKPEVTDVSTKVKLDVKCLIEEDDGVSTLDPIPLHVRVLDVDYEVLNKHPSLIEMTLDHEIPAIVEVESDEYNPDWTTQLRVQVLRDA